jgi:hypothetical protein
LAEVFMAASDRIERALAKYEAEHVFARQVSLPVEDRLKYMPAGTWQEGSYRWFRSPNIVCLEKYRRLRAAGRT